MAGHPREELARIIGLAVGFERWRAAKGISRWASKSAEQFAAKEPSTDLHSRLRQMCV